MRHSAALPGLHNRWHDKHRVILKPEPDLEGRHARGTENHGVRTNTCAEADTTDLVLLIQHIPHVGCGVDLRSCNIVPLDPGIEESVTADLGVGIERSDPVGRNVHARGEVRIVEIALRRKTGVSPVSGYSGIGKSAVVNELHKSLVSPRALFASGLKTLPVPKMGITREGQDTFAMESHPRAATAIAEGRPKRCQRPY